MTLFASSRRQLGWIASAIRKHFIWRGLLLIALQFCVETFAWLLGPTSEVSHTPGGGSEFYLYFGVLYGLGAAMLVAALLLEFDSRILIGISLIGVLVPQLLTPGADKVSVLYSPLTRVLLIPGHTNLFFVFYPLIPWFGMAVFGAVFGRWAVANYASASRRAAIIGTSFLALFLLVRIGNGFGNINPVAGSSWIDFLNVTKYPPSLTFILLTLGVDLLLLALFSHMGTIINKWGKPILVFGRVPLFFYLLHLYLYGISSHLLAPAKGTTLIVMYLYWIGGLALLYPLCIWYEKFKRSKSTESIWRFF
jgi:uncharacterized membrane protein